MGGLVMHTKGSYSTIEAAITRSAYLTHNGAGSHNPSETYQMTYDYKRAVHRWRRSAIEMQAAPPGLPHGLFW
jgi:hypothetical protein